MENTNTQNVFNILDTLASLIKPCACTHGFSQQSCRLNVFQNSESLKVWTTVMLNKCLNMFKSFTSMTTSGFFLFSPVIGHIKRRNRSFPISLFWHHVINLCQSQCVRVLTLTGVCRWLQRIRSIGWEPVLTGVTPSVNHSLTANHLVQHRKLTEKDTSCFWRPVIGRFFGLIVSPDVPENEEVMWSVFFSSVFVLIVTFDYISTYINWVINYDCTLTL